MATRLWDDTSTSVSWTQRTPFLVASDQQSGHSSVAIDKQHYCISYDSKRIQISSIGKDTMVDVKNPFQSLLSLKSSLNIAGDNETITCIAYSPSISRIAVGTATFNTQNISKDHSVKSPRTHAAVKVLLPSIVIVDWNSPLESYSSSLTITQRLSDATVFPSHRTVCCNSFTDVTFDPSGDKLASLCGSPDFTLTIWDWKNQQIILRTKAFGQDVFKVRFSPIDSNLLTTCGSGHIKFWQMAETFTGLKLQGEIGRFGKIDISDIQSFVDVGSSRVLSGSECGDLYVWSNSLLQFTLKQRISVDESSSKSDSKQEDYSPCHNNEVVFVDLIEGIGLVSCDCSGVFRLWSDVDDLQYFEASEDNDFKYLVTLKSEVSLHRSSENQDISKHHLITFVTDTIDSWYLLDSMGSVYRLNKAQLLNDSKREGCPSKSAVFTPIYHFAGLGVSQAESIVGYSHASLTSSLSGSIQITELESKKNIVCSSVSSAVNCIAMLNSSDLSRSLMTGPLYLCGCIDGGIRVFYAAMISDGCDFHLCAAMRLHDSPILSITVGSDHKTIVTSTENELFFSELILDESAVSDPYQCITQPTLKPIAFIRLSDDPSSSKSSNEMDDQTQPNKPYSSIINKNGDWSDSIQIKTLMKKYYQRREHWSFLGVSPNKDIFENVDAIVSWNMNKKEILVCRNPSNMPCLTKVLDEIANTSASFEVDASLLLCKDQFMPIDRTLFMNQSKKKRGSRLLESDEKMNINTNGVDEAGGGSSSSAASTSRSHGNNNNDAMTTTQDIIDFDSIDWRITCILPCLTMSTSSISNDCYEVWVSVSSDDIHLPFLYRWQCAITPKPESNDTESDVYNNDGSVISSPTSSKKKIMNTNLNPENNNNNGGVLMDVINNRVTYPGDFIECMNYSESYHFILCSTHYGNIEIRESLSIDNCLITINSHFPNLSIQNLGFIHCRTTFDDKLLWTVTKDGVFHTHQLDCSSFQFNHHSDHDDGDHDGVDGCGNQLNQLKTPIEWHTRVPMLILDSSDSDSTSPLLSSSSKCKDISIEDYSVEGEKLQKKLDAKMKAAEQWKHQLISELDEIRESKAILLKDAQPLIEAARYRSSKEHTNIMINNEMTMMINSEEDLDIDLRLNERISEMKTSAMKEVEDGMALECALNEKRLQKLEHFFFGRVECEYIPVSTFRHRTVYVSTFRSTKLPLWMEKDLREIKEIIKEEEILESERQKSTERMRNSEVGYNNGDGFENASRLGGDDIGHQTLVEEEREEGGGETAHSTAATAAEPSALSATAATAIPSGTLNSPPSKSYNNKKPVSGAAAASLGSSSSIMDSNLGSPTTTTTTTTMNTTSTATGKHQTRLQRKQKIRMDLKNVLLKLEAEKPKEKEDDPNDLEAIDYAERHIGDLKLKSSDDYKVPTHISLEMNASSKRKQLMLLSESISFIKKGLNERVLALRELKEEIIENITMDMDRLEQIHSSLKKLGVPQKKKNKTEESSLLINEDDNNDSGNVRTSVARYLGIQGQAAEDGSWLESDACLATDRYKVTDQDLKQFMEEKEREEARLSAKGDDMGFGGGGGGGGLSSSNTDETHKNDQIKEDVIKPNDDDDEMKEISKKEKEENNDDDDHPTTIDTNNIMTSEKPSMSPTKKTTINDTISSNISSSLLSIPFDRLCEVEKKRRITEHNKLIYERKILLDKMNAAMNTFDMAVTELREEKVKVISDVKSAQMKCLTLIKEWRILQSFESREFEINASLLKVRTEKAQIIVELSECQEKLNAKLAEIERWQEKDKEVMLEFENVVGGDKNLHYNQLKRIFKRKMKKKYRRKQQQLNHHSKHHGVSGGVGDLAGGGVDSSSAHGSGGSARNAAGNGGMGDDELLSDESEDESEEDSDESSSDSDDSDGSDLSGGDGNGGGDGHDGDHHSDDSNNNQNNHQKRKENKMNKNDDSCPKDCDNLVYERVLELREKRWDQEEQLLEFTKQINELKYQSSQMMNKERSIDNSLKQIELKIEEFSREKQKALNQIIVTIPLYLSQIHALYQDTNAIHPNSSVSDLDNQVNGAGTTNMGGGGTSASTDTGGMIKMNDQSLMMIHNNDDDDPMVSSTKPTAASASAASGSSHILTSPMINGSGVGSGVVSTTNQASDHTGNTLDLSDTFRPKLDQDKLDKILIIERSSLMRLNDRLNEQFEEQTRLENDFVNLKKEQKTLSKKLKVKQELVEVEKRKCEEVQFAKFGRLVPLEILDRIDGTDTNKHNQTLQMQINQSQESGKSILKIWNKRISHEKTLLKQAMKKDTALNQQLLSMKQESQKMNGIIDRILRINTIQDTQPLEQQSAAEIERLIDRAKRQQSEIEVLKAELQMMQRKGSMVYTRI